MKDRNAQLSLVAAIAIAAIVGLLLLANASPVNNACPWQFPKIASCLLSARETLAAGLIGAGGAVFAGWLAYSAAREFVWGTDDSQREFVEKNIAKLPDRAIITEEQKQEAIRLREARQPRLSQAARFTPILRLKHRICLVSESSGSAPVHLTTGMGHRARLRHRAVLRHRFRPGR
jgi:hypothetical protein